MRSKEKVTPRNDILKNFTREFLIEEKRRCEIDRYVCDFRILIHKRPHENHNYLSRLLQDYTTMFLSHERISANKMNQEDLKYQVKTQLASRKKQTPKQRYVKSKLSEKSDNISEHQSYLVLKAQTEEFLRKLRNYEELEQIAYEIFIKNANSVSKTYQYEMEHIIQPNTVLKLKSSEVPQDIPYKKHYRNVYVVNSPAATEGNSVVTRKIQNQNSESKSFLENYEHIKKETELFIQNNKNYNDAEQKMLTEQYRTNTYIKKYVDSLTSSEKPRKSTQTPKKGLYSKIKNMMGFSPENPTKFYKNVENTSGPLLDNTEVFLANERKYNNFEFEAYKLFYIKNGEFQNPLIEKIKNNAYESEKEPSGNARKIKIKHLVGLKNAKTNQRNPEMDEFEDFNLVKCSPNEPEQKIRDIKFQFDSETPKIGSKNYTIANVNSTNEQEQVLQQYTADFLKRQKMYEDKQRYFYVIHIRRHNINLKKEKKETLLLKIKHLFFGRHEKSKENLNYFKEITREFLSNEQYYYGLQKQAHKIFAGNGSNYSVLSLRPFEVTTVTKERITSKEPKRSTKNNESYQRSSVETAIEKKNLAEPQTPTKKEKNKSIGKSGTLKKDKSKISVSPLHQRSQSEDLLMFKTKTKSLDSRKSPTGHKTFSDRLKSMVGITNRRKTKSRENILSLTDPVHYFLEHERFYYEGVPQNGEKYGRSVSAIESTPKDGTLKTKTRRFLSTENVLYQDSNSSSIGKPPTGRRRKQERNRDSKEKRRSRTLSPAQKLVSKIRNLVQKSPDKKEEDPVVITKRTDKLSSDHSYSESNIKPSNISDTIEKTANAEKSPISNKILLPQMDKTEVKLSQQMENKAPSSKISSEKYSMKVGEEINEYSNILKDYQHIKTQTEEFVHDIKRYHDLDKNPDAMDKTLIFINNKSDCTPVVTQHIENTPGRQKIVLVKSMNVETTNDHSTLKTEKHTEFENSQSNSSSTNHNTQKIIQNTYVQQTRITERVTTEKVQRSTTQKIFSREIDSKNINEKTPSTLSPENEHTYENVSVSGVPQKYKSPLISESKIISTGKAENKTIISGDLITTPTNLFIPELKTENEEVNDHAYENVVFTAPTGFEGLVTSKSRDDRFNTMIEIEEKENNRKKIIEISDKKKSESDNRMPLEEKSVLNKKPTEISNLSGKIEQTDEVKRNGELLKLKSQKAAQTKIIPPSRTNKKKEKIITGVENLIEPQKFTKSKIASDDLKNNIIRDQTDEFLRKHQYLIHKEEAVLPKVQALSVVDNQKVSVETASKQSSTPQRIEKSPEKEQKSKKTTFSKLKTFVSGTPKKPTAEESNLLLRQQTSEFLDNVRKGHDVSEEANAKYRVVWLSDLQNKPTKAQATIKEEAKPIILTEDEKKKLRLIRQNTDIFLKDHQDYHNKQRNEDNTFFTKMGQPETLIWLSSRPIKKGDNIITKVKNLMSPQRTKKSTSASDDLKNKIIRDQTDEFLRKHQYLIHKEEAVLPKVQALSVVDNQKVSVETASKQSSAPKRIEKSPEKEQKSKKTTFSKLKTFVSGTPKKPTAEESNLLLRQQTSEFLDNVRKGHDVSEEANAKYRVVWLSDLQNKPTKAQATIKEEAKPIILTEDEKKKLRLIRQNTDIFLKDHQDYHNKQRNEDNTFFTKMGQPETLIWLSSRPIKKGDNIITKVKNLMSPQRTKKSTSASDDLKNKIIRDQTDEFLRKHQYLIHKEEAVLPKVQALSVVDNQKVSVETASKQSSAPKRIEKSPEKEQKSKKTTFSKLKTFVSGAPKKPTAEESNLLLRQQTSEFLDNVRKGHDVSEEANAKYRVVWLSDLQNKPTKAQATIKEEAKPIILTEDEKKKLRLIRQNTDIFLKDHQDYHNKQRNEDNTFFTKMGQPETLIWLSSRPIKKGDNIITKVKNLMSPQRTKKSTSASDDLKNKIIRDQTDEFLRKHQYLIHKEEAVLPKVQALSVVDNQKVSVETASKQSSAPKRIEKSPEKEQKSKKTTFSKLKTFVSGTPKKPTAEESNLLLRQQTSEFLDNVRKGHDVSEEANAKYRVVWLSDLQNKPTKAQATIKEEAKPIILTEDEKKKLRLIRQNTDIFLKDHQDYHNKQRNEDNTFFTKMGQPETLIWLSSRPIKKGDNIITKVKNLMSPQRTKKSTSASDDLKNKIIRDQTDEFLRKHQYLIHKEEAVLPKVQALSVVDNQKVSVETASKQSSAPKRIEKSPEKEQKSKKTTFSKLKTFVSGTPKKPTAEESNLLLRQQTSEFLDNVRKGHDVSEEANAKYRVVWLSDLQNKPTKAQATIKEEAKPIILTEDEKKKLRLIRQNTDIFLKDHQDYHNKQRNEDNTFFTKMGQPETLIWLSSRPIKKGDNIITKVKNLMSPQRTKKSTSASDDLKNKIIRDQTDEFLRKHQYLIHKEEAVLPKVQALSVVDNQKVSVETASKQSSAPKRIEKSPEKEQKSKKTTFSKLKTFVSGTPKKPTAEESNLLLRQQTSEFLDNVRKGHDVSEEANAKYRVVWLSDLQNKPTKAQATIKEEAKPIILTEDEKKKLRLIRQNTDIFLKDHQDYHNKQRNEDNTFFTKMGQPETLIWLSSRPIKKGDNIITKVKNLMSPQRTKKSTSASDDLKNKIIRDQTDEFLRKHQYLIHKEEAVLPKVQALSVVDNQKVSVETASKQSSAPKRIETSPEKEQKSKKTTFSKLKTFVSGTPKKPTAEESNSLLRQQTSEFLDNVRKGHDVSEEANAKYRVVWLSDLQNKPTKAQATIKEEAKPIILTEDEKKKLRLIRQNTDIFLKDHQDYHNKQRNEDNTFFTKMGQPETLIWLSSRPIKKGDNIITKVKNLMSPQRTKKSTSASDDLKNKIIRDQTDEFLRKHQYLIHKEEAALPKVQALSVVDNQKVSVETASKQSSAPKRIEKSPEKEQKSKKTTFSKLKTFVSGAPKKPTAEESNLLLRQQTSEFLDNVRKGHDVSEEANAKYRVVWLSDLQNKPTKAQATIKEEAKPIILTEDEKKKLRLIRQNTDIFLKDHQDYHNKQRNEDNTFFTKMGQPETLIWLSSRPIKKGDNIISKVKNLMSPQRTKKVTSASDDLKNKIIRDQTDEFLRKHQYLIHKEEAALPKVQALSVVDNQKVSVETASKQSSAPKRIEKSPEKEQKSKKTTFSKLKTFVSGAPKKPTAEESNLLLRQQTSEFLDNVRKGHDVSEEANAKYRVVWLSDLQNKPTKAQATIKEEAKPIILTEDEKKKLRLIRQNTDIFLKDHQDYHNKQRNEDNTFFTKMGQPETLIWLSSRPIKKGDNIITKVKNLMSPQRTKKSTSASDDLKNKIIRDQTDEFLRKHQYLIHKEEAVLPKVQALSVVDNQKVSVETASKQSSAPKRIEKSPEKEQKSKKTTFSKLKTFVSGTPKKPTAEESNLLLRQQTSEFLDNVRKGHDLSEEANAKYRVVWLSDLQNKPTKAQATIKEEPKPITSTEDEKKKLKLIKQNTDFFSKGHLDYNNKQHTENSKTLMETITVSEHASVAPIRKSPDDSNLKEIKKVVKVVPLTNNDSEDSKNNEERLPSTSRRNIVSKVKGMISPQKSSGPVFYYDISDEMAGKNEDSKLSEQEKDPMKCGEAEENLSPPPRHIKKVTFSQKKEMEEQSDNISKDDYSTESSDGIKPQAAPRKQVAKKVKTMFIDSAEIFKQNKESNLIPETDKFLKDHIDHQNKQWTNAQHLSHEEQVKTREKELVHISNKPEPTPRKEHIGYTSKSTQPNTLEVGLDKTYSEKRRMLVLFLDDHKAHHEKERNQFINFISKQNKPVEYERKTPGKEPKLKNKLMSKFKSLVGQSQENIASDTTRQNEIALRKQTSEFLISQKCYNDLENNAHNKFSLKQSEIKLHKNRTAADQTIADAPENSKLSFQEDSTFSARKLSLNGSPETTRSQKPLKSSPDKKISMTDDTTVMKIIDSQTNDNTGSIHRSPSSDHFLSLEHNINFLNDQRNYINSENETWRHYLKYEPVKVLKATNDTREECTKKNDKVLHSIPKQKDPPRKSSSQIESEKIDHEVILHQTKLFMENHKSFHDNLQNELSKYVPKESKINYRDETVQEKDQGVLTKIKSLITLVPTKSRSYEVNKPEVSTQKTPKIVGIHINETNESVNIAQPSKEIDDNFREITKNFLEDHQEYHNQQRLYSTDNIRQVEEKGKKNKKGVFSKIKSYMVGDSSKKSSKTASNAPTTIKHSEEMVQTVPNTEADVLIRELESSPRTTRRNRPRNIQYEELQISKQAPNDSKISANTMTVETREYVNPSSLKPHQTISLVEPIELEGVETVDVNKSLSKNLYYDEIKVLPKGERKKFAKDKINTQDFLLNEKRFTEIVGSKIEQDSMKYQKDFAEKCTVTGEDIPSIESNVTDSLGFMTRNQNEKQIKTKVEHLPSAPSLNELVGVEKENKQPVIQRFVKPISPTKTFFKEIRQREESPDRKVYVMKEGYIITRGNKEDVKSIKNDSERKAVQRKTLSSSFGDRPRMEDKDLHERGGKTSGNLQSHIDGSSINDSIKTTEGQDYVDRSNDSPSRSVPQGDLEVRRHHTKNCYFIFIVVLVVLIAIYCLREDENNN